jgi:hypothetical protein
MYGPAAGALTGGILGSFKRENPGDPTQGLNMALLGGGSGIASNLLGGAKGMDLLTGKGLSGSGQFATGLEGLKEMLSSPFTSEGRGKLADFAKIFDPAKAVTDEGTTQIIDNIFKDITDGVIERDKGLGAIRKLLQTESEKTGLSLSQLAALYGLGTLGLGAVIDATTDNQDVGLEIDDTKGNVLANLLRENVKPIYAAEGGGVMDLRQGGESEGPGTGTSDDIPAMLSDGEFVMTAKAVRGAGGGDRREGAKKMYEAMDKLEAQA